MRYSEDRHWLFAWVIAPLALVFIGFHKFILSGFADVPGDLGDARFNNLILEHTWRWITGVADLWSPNFFYPHQHVAAFSDTLIGVAPFYWLWRVITGDPFLAYPLWLITISLFNYVISYFIFKLLLESKSGAIGAALLFSASSIRLSQFTHPQLVFQGYSMLSLLAVGNMIKVLNDKPEHSSKVLLWVGIFFGGIVLQIYGSFYLGWIFIFTLFVASALALGHRKSRDILTNFLTYYWRPFLVIGFLSLVTLSPLLFYYQLILSQVGYREFGEVHAALPRIQSWLNHGPHSLVYGGLHNFDLFRNIQIEHENRLGIGLITLSLSLTGFWIYRRSMLTRYLFMTWLLLVAIVTVWPGIGTIWNYFYLYFPGAAAIRAPGRIALIISIIPAFGVGLWIKERSVRSGRIGITLLLLAIGIAEQLQTNPTYNLKSFEKDITTLTDYLSQERADALPCQHFTLLSERGRFDSLKYHIDAMWAANLSKISTLNGYSGNYPNNWELKDIVFSTPRERELIIERIQNWLKINNLDPDLHCIIVKQMTANRKRATVTYNTIRGRSGSS